MDSNPTARRATVALCAGAAIALAPSARAELTGGSVNPNLRGALAVTPTASFYELEDLDFSRYGAKLDYVVDARTLVFAGASLVQRDLSDGDGFGFTLGGLRHLPDSPVLVTLDVAVKGWVDYVATGSDEAGVTVDVDDDVVAAQLAASSPNMDSAAFGFDFALGLAYYRRDSAVGGPNAVPGDGSASGVQLAADASVSAPVGVGTLFAGARFLEGFGFGLGYRLSF